MEIKVIYSKVELEAAVNFVATHNQSFLGQHDKIRQAILERIQEIVHRYPNVTWIGTMGFYVWASMEDIEGIDSDENLLRIEFMVAPAVGEYGVYDEENEVVKVYHKKII